MVLPHEKTSGSPKVAFLLPHSNHYIPHLDHRAPHRNRSHSNMIYLYGYISMLDYYLKYVRADYTSVKSFFVFFLSIS